MLLSTTKVEAEGWQGQGEAGLVKTSGNTKSENFNLGLNFSKEGEVWSHEMGLAAYRSSSDGIESANSQEADYTVKRALSKRSNLFLSLSYLEDDFDGFTEQLSASAGYGYKVISSERTNWETGLGIGYRDTEELPTIISDGGDSSNQSKGLSVSGPTLVLRSNFSSQITENTEILDNFKAEIGSDNSFYENEAALVVAMNASFSLKVAVLARHNTDPSELKEKTDTITTLSLVYNFGR